MESEIISFFIESLFCLTGLYFLRESRSKFHNIDTKRSCMETGAGLEKDGKSYLTMNEGDILAIVEDE